MATLLGKFKELAHVFVIADTEVQNIKKQLFPETEKSLPNEYFEENSLLYEFGAQLSKRNLAGRLMAFSLEKNLNLNKLYFSAGKSKVIDVDKRNFTESEKKELLEYMIAMGLPIQDKYVKDALRNMRKKWT